MRLTIRRQLAVVFMSLLLGTLLCLLLANSFLLEKYYMMKKQNSLTEVYDYLNTAYNWEMVTRERSRQAVSDSATGVLGELNPALPIKGVTGEAHPGVPGAGDGISGAETGIVSEADKELERLGSLYNISYLVLDSTGDVLKASMYDVKNLQSQLLENVFLYEIPDRIKGTILFANDEYVLMVKTDNILNTDFMEMWGFLKEGRIFILRTPAESIRDAAKIATRFLAYVGIFAIVVGSIVIYKLSGAISGPVRELTMISRQMAQLDFDTRYTKETSTELGVLGNNMNILSDTLKTTIGELKSANLELRRDVEQKERIDSMRREFLSNVSHELKTPIALIQGYAEGLTEVADDSESREFYCEVISDEARKMNELVQSLLNLDNLESGRDVPVMERFDMCDFINNMVESMDILIKQSGVSFNVDLPEQLNVWADMNRCEHILRNFMSNALHHVTEGGEVRIFAAPGEDCVRISVYNTGKPIPEENLPHLWEKFYKVDKARTREYGGSGVGLSIVKASCESMNFRYGVQNHPEGVEFWFEPVTKAL